MTTPGNNLYWLKNLTTGPGINIHYFNLSSFLNFIVNKKNYHNFKIKQNRFFKKKDFMLLFLSSEELDTVNGFKSLKKQIEWMAGRFLVKHIVQSCLKRKTKLSDILISYHREGAPFLADFPYFTLSISHSGDYASAALCTTGSYGIGLDIEKIGRKPDSYFMKTAFTRKEIESMPHTPEEIFRRWTVKEAFLKYIKKGFNESLHKVEILDDKLFHDGIPADVSISSQIIETDYFLTLVSGPLIPDNED